MKILLVNNNTTHIKALKKALNGHDVDIQIYQPGIKFRDAGKDLVILSGGGGEGQEISDTHTTGSLWYSDEMDFVKNCQVPMIGICMGFEVMAKAHGAQVPELSKIVYEKGTLTVTDKGWQSFGKQQIKQVEAHSWYVPEAPNGFEELARSDKGVEIMTNGLQIGTQFHPELTGTLTLDSLLQLAIA